MNNSNEITQPVVQVNKWSTRLWIIIIGVALGMLARKLWPG